MIVKMKKLTLLVSGKEKEKFLKNIRNLGVIHVKNLKTPSADELQTAEEKTKTLKTAIAIVESLQPFRTREVEKRSLLKNLGGGKGFEPTPEQILSLAEQKNLLLQSLTAAEEEIEAFKPWGGFNPGDIEALKKKGVFIRLYRAQKNELKTLKEKNNVHVIKKDAQYTYIAQISKNRTEILPFEEIKLPEKSYDDYLKKCEDIRRKISEIDMKLKIASGALGYFEEYLKRAEKRRTFLNVMHGMGKEEKFSYLSGFCPIDKVTGVTELARSAGAGYLIEDPDKPEEVPTLIRNPKWVRIIRPVFKFMNAVPGYGEHDISPWFLIFFSLFFAMLISDAGYGLLFILLTFFARAKFRRKNLNEAFFLMYTLSFATVIWGAVTGTWFGFEKIAELPLFNRVAVQKVHSFVEGNENFMIYICFIIGITQLTLAHAVLAVKKINSLKAVAELGWIAILWGLFFTAGNLVIGRNFPPFAGYLFIIGISLVILFSNFRKNMLKGALISLSDLPLKIISSFSDIVSYLRLFAVGYASTVLASTFNNMAFQIGFHSALSGLAGALVLFFGHALNILLGLMAVIVHGIRLNMLEFSGQMGMEWSGLAYKPFNEN